MVGLGADSQFVISQLENMARGKVGYISTFSYTVGLISPLKLSGTYGSTAKRIAEFCEVAIEERLNTSLRQRNMLQSRGCSVRVSDMAVPALWNLYWDG